LELALLLVGALRKVDEALARAFHAPQALIALQFKSSTDPSFGYAEWVEF
jgi:hypothetical protein